MSARRVSPALIRALQDDLTDHDLAVLKSVSALRFASGDQLTRMHFVTQPDVAAQARAARRALVRLTRLDCLSRLPRRVGGVRAGSAGFVYRLGLAGQHLAGELGWQPQRRKRRSHVPGTFFVSHALAVAEVHTLLIEADRLCRFELLELSAEPACHRSYGGIGAQGQATLKPDSYARLGVGEFEDSYFVEVDMGSEGSQTLERKLKEYVAYQASGIEQDKRGVFPRVLWLAPDEQRAEAIEGCVERLPSVSRALFAVALQANALDAIRGTSEVTHT